MDGQAFVISFFVHGEPQSQGSMRAFMAGGKPVLTSTNKNLGAWRQLIAARAQEHAHLFDGPVFLQLHFFVPKPKSVRKGVKAAAKRPDIDKLARAALDAMTGVLYKDDAQVTTLVVSKRYAEVAIGVRITIEEDDAR